MTDDEKRALREKAEAATQGEWRVAPSKPPNVQYVHAVGITPCLAKLHDDANGEANAAFISAANPTAVLALLDENERLRLELHCSNHERQLRADRNVALAQQLSAMTASRDEACDALETWILNAKLAEGKFIEATSALAKLRRAGAP